MILAVNYTEQISIPSKNVFHATKKNHSGKQGSLQNTAEKSAEAFQEQKFAMCLFLNLLMKIIIFLSMAEQFNFSVFGK